MAKITVVVVDDSALIRALLTEIINSQPDMTVVGAAADPFQAREIIRTTNPNVVTLDIEMPRMDGLDFLEKIMRLRPMPVVMVSTLTERGAEVTMRALELGAVDFVAKPKLGVANGMRDMGSEICDKVRIAAKSRVFRKAVRAPAPGTPPPVKGTSTFSRHSTEKMIVIGASTGGTEAIREVLETFPADCPAVVITQHMPPGFTASFAKRLDGCCRIRVAEAKHGERILPGHAYIAPGGQHFAVARSGANYVVELHDTEPVNRHKPSVEVLFKSVARNVGPNAIGVMLTGMGKDGALAMAEMKRAGSYNFAQDEATCVVYGMPREAVAVGAVDQISPIGQIGPQVLERLMAGGKLLSRV